jgi:hypothetical protein
MWEYINIYYRDLALSSCGSWVSSLYEAAVFMTDARAKVQRAGRWIQSGEKQEWDENPKHNLEPCWSVLEQMSWSFSFPGCLSLDPYSKTSQDRQLTNRNLFLTVLEVGKFTWCQHGWIPVMALFWVGKWPPSPYSHVCVCVCVCICWGGEGQRGRKQSWRLYPPPDLITFQRPHLQISYWD